MIVGIQCNLMLGERLLMLNNSVTFSGKPMGFEELLNQTVKAFVIIINRRPKGRPRKRESLP